MTKEHEHEAAILVDETDRLIDALGVGVNKEPFRDPDHWRDTPPIFSRAASAYDKLAEATKVLVNAADRRRWETATVRSGRNGEELMDRLWLINEQVRGEKYRAAVSASKR
jgi:hypothetical protein